MESCKHCISNIVSRCNCWYRSFVSDLRFNYCAIIFFIITYGSILIFACFFKRMIEVSISVVCFHIFRHYDEKTFHASTDVRCWCISMISFSTITLLSMSLDKSILSTILLSYILTKIMYYIKDYIDLKKDKKISLMSINIKSLSLEELTSKLINVFQENDIKAIYTYTHRDKSQTADNIAMKYHISRCTLFRLVRKATNIIEKI